MKTYFVRHSGDLALENSALRDLREQGLIAVHFPFVAGQQPSQSERDATSLDPDDYAGSARSAMRRLVELGRTGGYVCATYRDTKALTVGRVDRNTPIKLVESKWSADSLHAGRTAVLKSLKLAAWMTVPASQQALLLSVLPRQGTLCVWHGIGERVAKLMEGGVNDGSLDSLHPTYQEVLCAEFLRQHDWPDIPRLTHLLQPVGRTMVDVDILGMADDGALIRAQVTYKWNRSKIDRLAAHGKPGDHLVFFCDVSEPYWDGPVYVASIRAAFKLFTETPSGRLWLQWTQQLV